MVKPVIDVGVATPTIPGREALLERAIRSINEQTVEPSQQSYVIDLDKQGAAYTRDLALNKITSKYVAFLDDDDELLPTHLEDCYNALVQNDADLVFPWFDVVGGLHPFPTNFGKVWNSHIPVHVPTTFFAKTQLVKECGGFSNFGTFQYGVGAVSEEWELLMRLIEANAVIYHLPKVTWLYHHDSGNTSGRPDRW